MMVKGLDAAGGNPENTEKIVDGIEKVDYVGLRGHVKMDPNHVANIPIYIFQVEKKDGKYSLRQVAYTGNWGTTYSGPDAPGGECKMSRSKEAVLGPFFLIGEPAYGIIFGRALMLIGSGLSLKFGVMGILNFAHGGFCMLGAYFVSWFRSLREFLGFADPGPFVGDRDRCPD